MTDANINTVNGRKKKIIVLIIIVAFIFTALIAAGTAFINEYVNSYKGVYPGVKAYDLDLSGMTESQAGQAIKDLSDCYFSDKNFIIQYNNKKVTISAEEAGIEYDSEKAANEAYDFGRDKNIFAKYYLLKIKNTDTNISPDIKYNTDIVKKKADEFAAAVETEIEVSGYKVQEYYLSVDLGKDGIALDKTEIIKNITDMIETQSFGTYTPEPIVNGPDSVDLQEIYDQIYTEPKEATLEYVPKGYTAETASQYDLETYTGLHDYVITEGVIGITFDIAEAQKAVDEAEASGDRYVAVKLIRNEPEYVDLNSMIYRDVLSTTTTKLNTGEKARTHNIDLAVASVNGTVLCPGDLFSYNSIVGPRTVARGYLEAKIFQNGEVVDGIGGGICQLSSTMYMATLLTDLKQVERTPHRFAVAYTKLGQDATVAWGALDYKFKNSTEWPIKIVAVRSGGSLTVTIYGTKTDNYTYELYSTTNEIIDYQESTLYVAMGSAKANELGLTKLGQNVTSGGKKGYKSTTYLIKYLNGEKVSSTFVNNSEYKTLTKTTYIAAYLDSKGNPIRDASGKLINPADIETGTSTDTSTGTTTENSTETSTAS